MKYYMTKSFFQGNEECATYTFHKGPERLHSYLDSLLGNPFIRVEVKQLASTVAEWRRVRHEWQISAWPDRSSNCGLWFFMEEMYAHL